MNGKEHVLIVEDDPNDAFFTQRAFQEGGIKLCPHVCTNAVDAIQYLEGKGEYADRTRFPFPNFLVTDLKMPGGNGFDLLRWLRDHPTMQVIPTVVLSSSSLPDDVKGAYCLGVHAYLCKPSSAAKFRAMCATLLRFWEFCEVPKTSKPSCEELLTKDS